MRSRNILNRSRNILNWVKIKILNWWSSVVKVDEVVVLFIKILHLVVVDH
ncbi:hypothetical protein [Mesomycoplasma ovipneumoniae]